MILKLTVLLMLLQASAYSAGQTATRGITRTRESVPGFEFRLEKKKKKKISIRNAEKIVSPCDVLNKILTN